MAEQNKNIGISRDESWLKLDNAAKIFPAVMNREFTSVFRIGCKLASPVKIGPLLDSLDKTIKRFPYYLVTLQRGLFWYYLERNDDLKPRVVHDEGRPCIAFPALKKNQALFRIIINGKTIAVEFLHLVTDGGGALEFFRSLLVTYFKSCGEKIEYKENIIDPSLNHERGESEDSYNRYFRRNLSKPDKLDRAWHIPFSIVGKGHLTVTPLMMDTDEVRGRAKELNVSVTEYLTAVYIYALREIYKSSPGPESMIRIEIPVNMRRLMSSNSMRNFSLFVTPGIDTKKGELSFSEIAASVHEQMKSETQTGSISRVIYRNVKPTKNIIIRLVPLFIKNIVLRGAFRKHGAPKYSGLITNLGVVRMPEETKGLIDSFHFIPPPPAEDLKVGCGVISYGKNLVITFANITESLKLERLMSGFLLSEGLKVKIMKY